MKKRGLSLLLALCMVLALLPSAPARAAEEVRRNRHFRIYYGTNGESFEDLVYDGEPIPENWPEGFSYDPETAVVTLKDFETTESLLFQHYDDTLTIRIEGSNSLRRLDADPWAFEDPVWLCLEGSGTLNAKHVDVPHLRMTSGTLNVRPDEPSASAWGLSYALTNQRYGREPEDSYPNCYQFLGGEVNVFFASGTYGGRVGIDVQSGNVEIRNAKVHIDLGSHSKFGLGVGWASDEKVTGGTLTMENGTLEITCAKYQAYLYELKNEGDPLHYYVGTSGPERESSFGEVFRQNSEFHDRYEAYTEGKGYLLITNEVTELVPPEVQPPVITRQPADASGKADEKVYFSVAAKGEGLSYQWQYSKDGGKSWVNSTSTSDTAVCTLDEVERDGWLYRCIVSSSNGTSVTSKPAKVTILPTILTQPKDAAGNVDAKVYFKIDAKGAGLTYQWQYSKDGGKTWINSTSTSDTAVCTLDELDRDGWLYHCIVKSSNGLSVTSSPAKVTILPTILTQPKAASGKVGEKVSFSIAAAGNDLTYQWQYSTDNGKTWKASSSKTTTATCTLTTADRDGWLYRCVVTAGNGKSVTSAAVRVTVLPAITQQPKDASGRVGEKVTFTVAATGKGLTYQWQYSTDGGNTWKTSSSTSTTATCTLASNRNGWLYRCAVKDANGRYAFSKNALVTVLPDFGFTQQPKDASGKVGDKVTFTVAAVGSGLKYQWQYSEDGGKTWKTSASKTTTATCTLSSANRDGWLYRCIVTNSSGKSVTSKTARVTVLPAITQQPKAASGKVGDVVKFTIAATGRNLTYQWQYSTDGGKTWNASSSKTTTATCTLTASRNGWLYRCIVKSSNGKSVTSATARVTVVK